MDGKHMAMTVGDLWRVLAQGYARDDAELYVVSCRGAERVALAVVPSGGDALQLVTSERVSDALTESPRTPASDAIDAVLAGRRVAADLVNRYHEPRLALAEELDEYMARPPVG